VVVVVVVVVEAVFGHVQQKDFCLMLLVLANDTINDENTIKVSMAVQVVELFTLAIRMDIIIVRKHIEFTERETELLSSR